MSTQNKNTKLVLEEYKKAINKIDDWFEYMNESKKDREFIHRTLNNLTIKLEKIYKTTQDKAYYSGFGSEMYYECAVHGVPYPTGAKCPRCESKNKE